MQYNIYICRYCSSMSCTIPVTKEKMEINDGSKDQLIYHKGVKLLCESGIKKVPEKYILPPPERPSTATYEKPHVDQLIKQSLKLPIIDFAELQGPNRPQVLKSLAYACKKYGFFQLINHGIGREVIDRMLDLSGKFFDLPFEERQKYMSADMTTCVRYGTSFNQTTDRVFCWRDFLKLLCHPLSDVLPHWPSSPLDFRITAVTYAKETKLLFLMIVEAIVESLGLAHNEKKTEERDEDEEEDIMQELEDGSQLMVVNCYPACPEPDLTLGMPPHSDYGFLTLLLQDEVEGLQIQFQDQWVTVQPMSNAFVVNVGDHLEIFSNGRYKSVLHRVIVNSMVRRISVASLHSLPFKAMARPSSKLINKSNPRRYKDTDFATFLNYISSREAINKNFLDSRKLNLQK